VDGEQNLEGLTLIRTNLPGLPTYNLVNELTKLQEQTSKPIILLLIFLG